LHERKVIEDIPWIYPESKAEFTKVINDKAYIKPNIKSITLRELINAELILADLHSKRKNKFRKLFNFGQSTKINSTKFF